MQAERTPVFDRLSRKLYFGGILGLVGLIATLVIMGATGTLGTKAGDGIGAVALSVFGLAFVLLTPAGYVVALFEGWKREREGDAVRPAATGPRIVEETATRITVRTAQGSQKVYRVSSTSAADIKAAIAKLRANGCTVVSVEDAE